MFVVRNLKRDAYQLSAIGIDKAGHWHWQKELSSPDGKTLEIRQNDQDGLVSFIDFVRSHRKSPPVLFCLVHGQDGEDGRIQALCEMLDLPFVGPSSVASGIGMDKLICKELVSRVGVPVVPYLSIRRHEWELDPQRFCTQVSKELGDSVFVKPVRGGSSVGIHRVRTSAELPAAVADSLLFHDEVLVELAIQGREIEIAALGGYEPAFSCGGEIIMQKPGEYYDYENKYAETSRAEVRVPANLTTQQMSELTRLATLCFKTLRLHGMSRLDFFLVAEENRFYFNEVNTIPGFTPISQYPQLWAHSGIQGPELLQRLLDLAVERQTLESALVKSL
jgi:D-alanine-D-alanine ligase